MATQRSWAFFLGLVLLQFFFFWGGLKAIRLDLASVRFFFFYILVQNLFGIKIFESVPNFEGVSILFFKGKQIKKFKLLYINFFFPSQGVPFFFFFGFKY